MAPDEQPNPSQDMLKQLWSTMERFGMAAGKMPAQMLGMPTVPMPGGLAESQVAAIVGAIRAQRSGITNMRANLDAYEQQLVVMEQLIEPLEAMTCSWPRPEEDHGLTSSRRYSRSAANPTSPGAVRPDRRGDRGPQHIGEEPLRLLAGRPDHDHAQLVADPADPACLQAVGFAVNVAHMASNVAMSVKGGVPIAIQVMVSSCGPCDPCGRTDNVRNRA